MVFQPRSTKLADPVVADRGGTCATCDDPVTEDRGEPRELGDVGARRCRASRALAWPARPSDQAGASAAYTNFHSRSTRSISVTTVSSSGLALMPSAPSLNVAV